MIYHRTRSGITSEDWTICVSDGRGKRITRTFRGTKRDAERAERDLETAIEEKRWQEIDRTRLRATVTLSQIATEWVEMGMPKPGGRPRDEGARNRLTPFLDAALRWWGGKSPVGIGPRDFETFGSFKRANARTGTGERQADLELVALHNLCVWSVSAGRLTANPFANRPQYRDPKDVVHCTEKMPTDSNELHRLLGHMMAKGGDSAVAAAHLMLCAFTGLRAGEAGIIRRDGKGEQPGAMLIVTREGAAVRLMRVDREKGGTNPAVRVHAALESFLAAWNAYHAAQDDWNDTQWLFPNPSLPKLPFVAWAAVDHSSLGKLLTAAVQELGIAHRTPHGMRAFYVQVRRSQGISDAMIGDELGHKGGAAVVVKVYGKRNAILGGDGLHDWLPSDPSIPVAWSLLDRPANVVAMAAAA